MVFPQKAGVRVAGVDDAPFARRGQRKVLVVTAIYRGGDFLEGLLSTHVSRDGANATKSLIDMFLPSKFLPQLHAILLDGIALGGFNVVDIARLSEATARPVMVVCRRPPDMEAIRRALERVPGGGRKWELIRRAGPMVPVEHLHCQMAGISLEDASWLIRQTCTRSRIPEPLRAAHLIAGGVVLGQSGRRA